MNRENKNIAVLGGGFTGLRLAYLMSLRGYDVTLVERDESFGGMVRTFSHSYNGKEFLFDFGPHLFFREYRDQYEDLTGGDLAALTDCFQMYTRHHSKLLTYPLKPLEMLYKVNPLRSAYYILDFLVHKLLPVRGGTSSEDLQTIMTRRFGSKLYKEFYEPYITKCCGLSPDDISPAWALERENVSGKSLGDNILKKFLAMISSKFRKRLEATNDPMAESITAWYPAMGAGQICDEMTRRMPSGSVWTSAEVVSLRVEDNHIAGVIVKRAAGNVELQADCYVSTIPIPELAGMMSGVSGEIREAARHLDYRMVRLVNLIINKPRVLKSLEVFSMDDRHLFKRVYEPKAMSRKMSPDDMSSLSLEVCCSEGDEIAGMSEKELAGKCAGQLVEMGVLDSVDLVVDSFVVDMPRAYPVYRHGFEKYRDMLLDMVSGIDNLITTGRQGLFRYHAMTNETMEMAEHVMEFLESSDGDKKASYAGSRWGQSFY